MKDAILHWLEKGCDRLLDLRNYPVPRNDKAKPPRIVAHRGAWDSHVTENSMAAFKTAMELGAWAIEFDVHFTRDGEPVVHHDPTFGRIFKNPGAIREMTFAEIKSAGIDLPHLREVLALKNTHFMIELKVAMDPAQVRTIEQLLNHLEPSTDYHLLSLQPELVRLTEKLPPKAWILVGDTNVPALARAADFLGLGGVAAHYLFVTDYWIHWLHQRGIGAGVGFVPTPNLYRREWGRGVDWVFTNHLNSIKSVSN